MDDLANKTMDSLRPTSTIAVAASWVDIFDSYTRGTSQNSKLRYYCAAATASFLSGAGIGAAQDAAITDLFSKFPDFEQDVRNVQDAFPTLTRAHDPDRQADDNPFGPCEFHTHRLGDVCHASANGGCRIYVGNVAYEATNEDLMNFFRGYRV
jgi:hypothetical protein